MKKSIIDLRFKSIIMLAVGTIFLLLLCPFPARADISFVNNVHPALNPAYMETATGLVKQAINRLATDQKLINHPIRRYQNNASLNVKIIFDNLGTVDGAKVINNNEIYISPDGDLVFYLKNMVHEFIHVDIAEKYGDTLNYTFLPPKDYAFLNLMEEAFANAITMWLHLTYPEIPSDYEIRRWRFISLSTAKADAMRNDYIDANPQYHPRDEQEINNKVAGEMFNLFMTGSSVYTLKEIPRNMSIAYGRRNTLLIPEYNAYRDRSDALLRHVWNYMASIMPFRLPSHMTYDYYSNMFMSWVTFWGASFSRSREDTILYWINFDAAAAARSRLAATKENERIYNYLPKEDERRLNRIMREIDPAFIAVDTNQHK